MAADYHEERAKLGGNYGKAKSAREELSPGPQPKARAKAKGVGKAKTSGSEEAKEGKETALAV